MSYISAFMDGDVVKIVERVNGERILKEDTIDYVFYTLDPYGDHTTIFGEKCTRHSYQTRSEFYTAKKQYPATMVYEDDVNHLYRYLSNRYDFDAVPEVNVAFYDIEVEFREETRYSTPERADNQVISVAVYQAWCQKMIVLVLPPPTMTYEQAEKVCELVQSEREDTACIVFDNEGDLLKSFLVLIENADVISGWNSESYDFRYLTNRITKIIGSYYTRKLCLFDKEPVEKIVFNKITKSEEAVYQPVGRVHLDYMSLYKKYTYTQLPTYKLDYVAEVELGEHKVEYDGTLDQLYKYDFEKFVRYNIQDTFLVHRIDQKLKFIELTNLLAHSNGVLMETTLGTVGLTEQAILNQGHYFAEEPRVFPSRPPRKNDDADEDDTGAAGAYVANPKKGIRKLVAGNDINSLYPSAIRALNMSPETLVGQINSDETDNFIIEQVKSGKAESFTEAWSPLFNTFEFDYMIEGRADKMITLEFNRSDEKITVPAGKIRELIFGDSKLCVSANGTVFSREKMGLIPQLLARWYRERKQMQAEAAKWDKIRSEEKDPDKKAHADKMFSFWDQRQMAKKINLNALYGALLNKHCRFYDKRIGQSTTLTGRSITKHMASDINRQIAGVYDHDGDAIVAGDTDSAYYSVYEAYKSSKDKEKMAIAEALFNDRDMAIEMYNSISDSTNATFPNFMDQRFNTGIDNGSIIKAGRENLASYSLFIKKKRYAMNLFDKDGIRQDVNGKTGKLKIMGIEIKRSDTPKIIQDVLKQGLELLLNGSEERDVLEHFIGFKKKFLDSSPWLMGKPGGANAVTHYSDLYEQWRNGEIAKPRVPSAIMGAIAWNHLLEFYNEDHLPRIENASKVVSCSLKENDFGYTKISFPTGHTQFPDWFKQLPFDTEMMVEKIYYKKVDNIFGVLEWDMKVLSAKPKFHTLFQEDDD